MPEVSHEPGRLLSGRLLARNIVWNLLGNGLPLLVALWAIPVLIHGMGTDRFGLLSIIWMGIGYFSLFDLGMGQALTKLVAERLGDGREAELPCLINTGLKLIFALGLIAALIVAAITPWLTGDLLKVPANLVHETRWSFWILAATLPLVVSTAGLIGILQAHQQFPVIAAVRAPLGIMNFLGPALILTITPSLIATTLILALSRLLAWVTYFWLCRSFLPAAVGVSDRLTAARELLNFGGWVTVSNVVGPLMVYCDRFVIGALLTMTAVAHYTTPYDVVTRLWIVPTALAGVLFPALTMALATNPVRAQSIFGMAARVLLSLMFIPLAIIMIFAPNLLNFWLGPVFAQASSPVLRWLVIGVFINSLGRLPYILLQSSGRPDLTGKLHFAELPIYVLALWGLVSGFGIVGVAAAWSLRIAFDTLALFAFGMYYVPDLRRIQLKTVIILIVATSCLVGLAFLQAFWLKFCIAAGIVLFGGGWTVRNVGSMYLGWAEQERIVLGRVKSIAKV